MRSPILRPSDMGSLLYDYLGDSFLFDDQRIADDFRSITDADIKGELERYWQFCVNEREAIEGDARALDSTLKLMSGTTTMPLNALKQSALYVDQCIVNDPLFLQSKPDSSWHRSPPLGLSGLVGDRRQDLLTAVRYLKDIAPLVAANFVKPLPQPASVGVPAPFTIHSGNEGLETVPTDLRDWFRKRAKLMVQNVKTGKLKTFRKAEQLAGMQLPPSLFVAFDNDEPNFTPAMLRGSKGGPAPSISIEELADGLEEVVDRAGASAYTLFTRQAAEAERFGAEYLTRSSFALQTLERAGTPNHSTKVISPARALIQLDLPFLHQVTLQALMEMRENEAPAHAAFRLELERQIRVAQRKGDPDEAQKALHDSLMDLYHDQLPAVEREVKTWKAVRRFDTVVQIAAFCIAVAQPIAAVRAAALLGIGTTAAREWVKQRQSVTKSPAYFSGRPSRSQRLAEAIVDRVCRCTRLATTGLDYVAS